jgi:hypothetical protein
MFPCERLQQFNHYERHKQPQTNPKSLLPTSTKVGLLPNITKREAMSSRYRCTPHCRRPYMEFVKDVRHQMKPERRLVCNGTKLLTETKINTTKN